LAEILFPVPGIIDAAADSDKEFTYLVRTGDMSGMMRYQDYRDNQRDPDRLKVVQGPPRGRSLVLAARIRGKETGGAAEEKSKSGDADKDGQEADTDKNKESAGPTVGDASKSDEKKDEPKKVEKKPVNCIYVADIDLMSWQFLRIRARPGEGEEINWRFENVTFLLNIIDSLTGDDEYIDIRKRQIRHSTLRVIEEETRLAHDREHEQQLKFEDEIKRQNDEREKKTKETLKKLEDRKAELEKKRKEGEEVSSQDLISILQELALEQQRLEQRDQVARERAERERSEKIERIRRETDLQIQKKKNWYKFIAVALPPIPPLLVGVVVFARRRLREREGVSKARLR
jgi:ABC-2 type transport system permease protein